MSDSTKMLYISQQGRPRPRWKDKMAAQRRARAEYDRRIADLAFHVNNECEHVEAGGRCRH